MEKQITFTDVEYCSIRKVTRLEKTLQILEEALPISEWCEMIRPYYFIKGNGREPTSLEVIFRMYLLSQWQNMSDEICEDMLCRDYVCRNFVGVTGNPPDATTLGKFRNLLEKHELNKQIFKTQVRRLKAEKIIFTQGTIVDSTIIAAPDSRKNKNKEPNPEFSSTQKGTNRYRGMKAHIGVDVRSGLVHSLVTTTAKASDIATANECLQGSENIVRGDAAYIGLEKRPEVCEKFADRSGEKEKIKISVGRKRLSQTIWIHKKRAGLKFIMAKRKSKVETRSDRRYEKKKAQKRWRVENVFLVIKHIFGFRKTRLPTLKKNENKNYLMFALANCYMQFQRGLSTKTAT